MSEALSAPAAGRVAAVVVNHDAGPALVDCVRSLEAEGVDRVVVVDNASGDGSPGALAAACPRARVVLAGRNLGYGSAVNRGVAALTGPAPEHEPEFVLVANPDVTVHPGALAALVTVLDRDRSVALAGPRLLNPDGTRYPSARRFPSPVDAAGHLLLALFHPHNRFSRRYRMDDTDLESAADVDWVSGACLLVRRRAFEELGGFDEAYFMYAEDMDLCWRARRAGWTVRYEPAAAATHLQGLSTARHPLRMLVAHHRSALRFARRSTTGWRRVLLPAVAAALVLRLVAASARVAAGRG